MSAYIMEPEKIAEIGAFVDKHAPIVRGSGGIWLYKKGRDGELNRHNGQRVADLLMLANVKSVNYRYGERKRTRRVSMKGAIAPSPRRLFNLLRELEYQSCEPKNWQRSDGYIILKELFELGLKVATEGDAAGETGGWNT